VQRPGGLGDDPVALGVDLGSLAEFLAASPLRDSELEVDRVDATPRDVAP
jgi:hypothetical protein